MCSTVKAFTQLNNWNWKNRKPAGLNCEPIVFLNCYLHEKFRLTFNFDDMFSHLSCFIYGSNLLSMSYTFMWKICLYVDRNELVWLVLFATIWRQNHDTANVFVSILSKKKSVNNVFLECLFNICVQLMNIKF